MTNDIMPVVEEIVEELALKEGFLPSAQNIVDQREGPCLLLLSLMLSLFIVDWREGSCLFLLSSMISFSIKDSIADYRAFDVWFFCETLDLRFLIEKRTSVVQRLFFWFERFGVGELNDWKANLQTIWLCEERVVYWKFCLKTTTFTLIVMAGIITGLESDYFWNNYFWYELAWARFQTWTWLFWK